ncbi:UPF0738 family protein [Sutcliffiella cohnii]|uniref:Uncharacterized protein n=1 Tax=Sutcliffiella cohnii TaxID=33932 RepID=A0A223KMS4_9BACI|nr:MULTISPECIES: hypothetical protein [Sutcliffiella]AST90623.1 hypothetical protein BC6307_04675 [Sutcliffiella cohnii]MED4016911.1 hypothetical protein [Sutcliffiella cohnii]WBL16275.1 hypothetical protein O1A01_06495 [Sutcliffiella sp. NC1]
MQKRIEIKETLVNSQQLQLLADEVAFSLEEVQASNQMLVDSDQLSFIYKLETATEFVYVSISHSFWSAIKNAVEEKKAIVLVVGKIALLLTQFAEELQYLVENIKDNANYGEDMEKKVTEVFFA